MLLVWWATRPVPLTAEERQFVGWWTAPTWTGPDPKALSPVYPTAAEYRADRTTRTRMVNASTGEVTFVVSDMRWRAADGKLVTTYPRATRELVPGALLRGEFNARHESVWRVTWDGPTRYESQRVNLPPGVVWPVGSLIRCDPPADAPP